MNYISKNINSYLVRIIIVICLCFGSLTSSYGGVGTGEKEKRRDTKSLEEYRLIDDSEQNMYLEKTYGLPSTTNNKQEVILTINKYRKIPWRNIFVAGGIITAASIGAIFIVRMCSEINCIPGSGVTKNTNEYETVNDSIPYNKSFNESLPYLSVIKPQNYNAITNASIPDTNAASKALTAGMITKSPPNVQRNNNALAVDSVTSEVLTASMTTESPPNVKENNNSLTVDSITSNSNATCDKMSDVFVSATCLQNKIKIRKLPNGVENPYPSKIQITDDTNEQLNNTCPSMNAKELDCLLKNFIGILSGIKDKDKTNDRRSKRYTDVTQKGEKDAFLQDFPGEAIINTKLGHVSKYIYDQFESLEDIKHNKPELYDKLSKEDPFFESKYTSYRFHTATLIDLLYDDLITDSSYKDVMKLYKYFNFEEDRFAGGPRVDFQQTFPTSLKDHIYNFKSLLADTHRTSNMAYELGFYAKEIRSLIQNTSNEIVNKVFLNGTDNPSFYIIKNAYNTIYETKQFNAVLAIHLKSSNMKIFGNNDESDDSCGAKLYSNNNWLYRRNKLNCKWSDNLQDTNSVNAFIHTYYQNINKLLSELDEKNLPGDIGSASNLIQDRLDYGLGGKNIIPDYFSDILSSGHMPYNKKDFINDLRYKSNKVFHSFIKSVESEYINNNEEVPNTIKELSNHLEKIFATTLPPTTRSPGSATLPHDNSETLNTNHANNTLKEQGTYKSHRNKRQAFKNTEDEHERKNTDFINKPPESRSNHITGSLATTGISAVAACLLSGSKIQPELLNKTANDINNTYDSAVNPISSQEISKWLKANKIIVDYNTSD
ncbi:MAG: hypothetical protein KAG14_03615, partial [Mycoplasmataceae bacterium]|nr:hypothetical protein [Mycoplasmataceae bacterium]